MFLKIIKRIRKEYFIMLKWNHESEKIKYGIKRKNVSYWFE